MILLHSTSLDIKVRYRREVNQLRAKSYLILSACAKTFKFIYNLIKKNPQGNITWFLLRRCYTPLTKNRFVCKCNVAIKVNVIKFFSICKFSFPIQFRKCGYIFSVFPLKFLIQMLYFLDNKQWNIKILDFTLYVLLVNYYSSLYN